MESRYLVILVALVANAVTQSWNYMDCLHGSYVPYPVMACDCDNGWSGIDCSVCESSQACGSGLCQQTSAIITDGLTGFSCEAESSNPSNTGASFSFVVAPTESNDGDINAEISAYYGANGGPLLYNCTLAGCYVAAGNYLNCLNAYCACTSECSQSITQIVNAISGQTSFVPYSTVGSYEFSAQSKFSSTNFVLTMTCNVSSCSNGGSTSGSSTTGSSTTGSFTTSDSTGSTSGSGSCYLYDTCSSCADNGCYWCLENSYCESSSNGCQNVIHNPDYCPADPCNYDSCYDCTETTSCIWCLDTQSCFAGSTTSNQNCSDYIKNEQWCPS